MTASRFALLAAFVCAWAGAKQDTPRKVTIYRDKMGVPHVVGDTPEALYFGGGYALAQDRLAEFERSRRAALGRMAEIDSSKVEADKRARLVAYTQAETQAMFDALAPEYQRMLRAHLAGMNKAIAEAIADPQNKMPYEFGVLWNVTPERWTVHDLDFLELSIAVEVQAAQEAQAALIAFVEHNGLQPSAGEAKTTQVLQRLIAEAAC